VELVWFLLGLLVGLVLLGWHHMQLNFRLRRLIQALKPDALNWSLSSSTARLTREIASYVQEQEERSKELEDWRQLSQISPTGFLWVDEDNQLIQCNPQALKLLGVQNPPSQPRLLLELVRSYELDQLIEQTREAGEPRQKDWTFYPVLADASVLSQQSPRPLRGYAFPLQQGHVGIFLENRQEAVSLAQQRDRWISDVAHELKTPLTSIRLVVETLQLRLEPPLLDWADRLLKETIRLSNLVQDLLDLSQLESHPAPKLALRTVDVARLIKSTWLNLEPLARRKQLQLDYVGPDQLLMQADESRLHRVLLNLLDNSIKYSPSLETIKVKLDLQPATDSADGQQVTLDIIDAGPGFPDSAIPHVFERFYRADPSRTRGNAEFGNAIIDSARPSETSVMTNSGSGLGLAIVRQIVEAHGGSVKASNHPETGGAWLQVCLPYRE